MARQDDELRFLRQLTTDTSAQAGELMSRPLTGSIRQRQGRWCATLPSRQGVDPPTPGAFVTEDEAGSWLDQAVAAVQAGTARFPIRSADPVRHETGRARPPQYQPDIASVANAWMAAAYEDLRRGGPERAERVRRIVDAYLVPWFAPRTDDHRRRHLFHGPRVAAASGRPRPCTDDLRCSSRAGLRETRTARQH